MANGIHILSRYYDEVLQHPDVSSVDAVLAAMHEMWQPVVFTSLTTAAGFLSFLTASILPIRYFGIFTSIGVLAAMVFSIIFFPALLSLLPVKVSRGLRAQMGRSGDLAATGWAARTLSRLGVGVARKPLVVWGVNALVVTASFLVFLTSNFRPNFYLGAMLSLNMGACFLVSMTVLPAILNTFKPRFVYGGKAALVGTPQPSVEGQTA